MIRVLIVDDHVVVRRGLAAIIAERADMELVGEASDGEEAVALVRERAPDVVLVDLAMPNIDGIETTRRILAARPETHVTILTSFAEHARIRAAFDAGALGYLLKDADPEDLASGVRLLASGNSPLAAKAARVLVESRSQASTGTGAGEGSELTPRERTVLELVATGCANKEIARRLEISERTVKAHLTRIFRSLGVFDRVQAALWARDHGFGAFSS
jgi:DNA-binding NarL/FixJ family response regulator